MSKKRDLRNKHEHGAWKPGRWNADKVRLFLKHVDEHAGRLVKAELGEHDGNLVLAEHRAKLLGLQSLAALKRLGVKTIGEAERGE
jgi:hypothetical protein